MLQTRVLTDAEIGDDLLARIRGVVFEAYAGDFSDDDWEHTRGGWRVVLFEADAPVSHAAVVPRVLQVGQQTLQTGYVEGVATTANRRRRGLGGLVTTRATSLVQTEFEMGALSTSSQSFYQQFGWESWRGPAFVRDGAALLRTADEDDGLMVLRYGRSAGLDLGLPIVCERRSGDNW